MEFVDHLHILDRKRSLKMFQIFKSLKSLIVEFPTFFNKPRPVVRKVLKLFFTASFKIENIFTF